MKPKPSELLPCPFCGGVPKFSPETIDDDSLGNVYCLDCNSSSGGDLQTKNQAIKNWNTRTKPSVKWPEKYYCSLHDNNESLACSNCADGRIKNATINACKAAVEAAGMKIKRSNENV